MKDKNTPIFYEDEDGYLCTESIDALKGKQGRYVDGDLYMFFDKSGMWFVNVDTLEMRQWGGPNDTVAGFADSEIDWELDVVKKYKKNVQNRQIAYGKLEKSGWNSLDGGIILKWCIYHEYGGMGDSDGYGVEPDEWEYLYIRIGNDCEPLSKWTSLSKLNPVLDKSW